MSDPAESHRIRVASHPRHLRDGDQGAQGRLIRWKYVCVCACVCVVCVCVCVCPADRVAHRI